MRRLAVVFACMVVCAPLAVAQRIGSANRLEAKAGAPPASQCVSQGDVGKVWPRNDAKASYECLPDGAGGFAWFEKASGPVGTSTDGQVVVNASGALAGKDQEGVGAKVMTISGTAADGRVPVWITANNRPEWGDPSIPTNAQTGTSYTVLTADRGKLVTFSNAGAITVTLPDSGGAGFAAGWFSTFCSIGAGTTTVNRTTSSTINGATSKTLTRVDANTWACAKVVGDGTNWNWVDLKLGSGGGGLGYTMYFASATTLNPTDGTTYYLGTWLQGALQTTEANALILEVPKDGTIKRFDVYVKVAGTLGSNENVTVVAFLNSTTAVGSVTMTWDAANNKVSSTGLSQAVTAGNDLTIRFTAPTWATNPTSVTAYAVVYIE